MIEQGVSITGIEDRDYSKLGINLLSKNKQRESWMVKKITSALENKGITEQIYHVFPYSNTSFFMDFLEK